MKFTDGEKLIALMLCEVLKELRSDDIVDPDFIEDAILKDYTWSISFRYNGIPFENDELPDIVKEVMDILDMWSLIERSYERLDDEDKSILLEEVGLSETQLSFKGFDGNNEPQFGIANFLIHKLSLFSDFSNRDINAHLPTIDMHRRMLVVFNRIKPENGLIDDHLSMEQMSEIISEIIHPENR